MKTCRNGKHQYEKGLRRCPECKRETARAGYHRNLTKSRSEKAAAARRYRNLHGSQNDLVYLRAWRKANRDKVRKLNRRWYLANRERARAKAAEYQKQHPDQVNEYSRRRHAKKKGVSVAAIRQEDLSSLLLAQGGRCRYCKAMLGRDKELDHRIPISRGGAHALENVCWACRDCNRRKGVRPESEFLSELEAA